MLVQRTTKRSRSVFRMSAGSVIALLLVASVTAAQLGQTIESEAQLASVLCRNANEGDANELLLEKNAPLVNVRLWNALVECASSAQRQASPAKSIEIYKLSLRVADRVNNPELVATTYYHLGRTYSGIADFQQSIQAFETSRKLFEQAENKSSLTYVLADLGALHFSAEQYGEAQAFSEQSLAIAGELKSQPMQEAPGRIEYGEARALHTLGAIDLSRGHHEDALNRLRQAFALAERLNGIHPAYSTLVPEVRATLARLYGERGEYAQALSHLSKAQKLARTSGDPITLANIRNVLGLLFLEQEDYVAAKTWFDESLSTYRSWGNAREEARVLLNLSVIEQRRGQHDDALQLFQRTMERANTAKLVDLQIAAGQGMGIVLTAKPDFPNALKAINESLELARRVNAKTREAELLWRAAQTHYAMQNYRESAALAEQALTLARALRLPKLTFFATTALGDAYAADGKVELAITTLKEAVSQSEEIRDKVAGAQESRQLFFENKLGPYHALVKLLTKQGKNFEALLYAERAKGRVLLEAVRNNRTDLKNIYTEGERVEGRSLIDKLSAIRERIKSESDSEAKNELQKQLDAVRRDLVLFQQRLAVAHPELLLRAGPAKPLTEASLSSLVRANDFVYVEYVVTAHDVGIFILKRNGAGSDHDLKYVKLPVNAEELRRKVNEFHSTLAERHPDYVPLGRELYRLLVAPVANELQNIKTICIIPDEFLWTLPFQALTTPRGTYLIQEHSLFNAPSLSVLKEMSLRRPQASTKESLLAFGNPVIERDEERKQDLHPLPEAEAEVAAVATAVRTRMKRILLGRQADEKTFKTLAPQYATIHLATHGILDNRDPLNSYLLLTKTVSDSENDGLLRAHEIIDMHLDADLAVLSACETANGRISPGEGVIGMSWAFFVAGARSVVVSQWRVNSASTSHLMRNFYRALARENNLDSQNKSQALREASLRLLNDRRYRHPFYWASFVLVSSN